VSWRSDACALCRRVRAAEPGYGVLAIVTGIEHLLDEACPPIWGGKECDSVDYWCRLLPTALRSAAGMAMSLRADDTWPQLDRLSEEASHLLSRWQGPQDGWAAVERDAVLDGGPLEHLRDHREPGACPECGEDCESDGSCDCMGPCRYCGRLTPWENPYAHQRRAICDECLAGQREEADEHQAELRREDRESEAP